jgi:hypothetical protein
VLLKREAYVGGKQFDNRGGNFVDFLFRSTTTRNAILVEFKTPEADLVLATRPSKPDVYRNNTLHPGKDVVGGVQQILTQRDSLRDEYGSLFRGKSAEELKVFAPRMVLVVGDTRGLVHDDERRSFELFRRNSREVEIVTFNELHDRAKMLLALLEDDIDS